MDTWEHCILFSGHVKPHQTYCWNPELFLKRELEFVKEHEEMNMWKRAGNE